MPLLEIPAKVLVGIVALIHVYIALLETVLFKSRGGKVFGLTPEQVAAMASAMSNQGVYNAFLAVALGLGLFWPDQGIAHAFVFYGLGCVFVAGLWGAFTVKRTILFIQAYPALLALLVYVVAYPQIG